MLKLNRDGIEQPMLRDSSGRLTIGPPRGLADEQLFANGATSMIYRRDLFWGVYIDDTTPGEWEGRVAIAQKMLEAHARVVVSYRPDEGHKSIEGCICALEWYPWAYGFDPYPLPRAQAYILAKFYAGPGRRPTFLERARLFVSARRHNPEQIWWY